MISVLGDVEEWKFCNSFSYFLKIGHKICKNHPGAGYSKLPQILISVVSKVIQVEFDRAIWQIPQFKDSNLIKEALELLKSRDQERATKCLAILIFFDKLSEFAKRMKQRASMEGGGSNKELQEMLSSFPAIPPDSLIYPSMEQLKRNPPSTKLQVTFESSRRLYIREVVEKSLRVFSSKDKPFMVSFRLSDMSVRSLIFKEVNNVAPESITSNVFSACFVHTSKDQMQVAENLLNCKPTFYSIVPFSKNQIVLEVVDSIQTLRDYAATDRFKRSSDDDRNPEEIKTIQYYFFTHTYSGLNSNQWFQRKVNLNFSMGFWWIVGAIFGIGDRNLMNIMVGKEKGFVYIDFEAIMGIGRNLPIPETVKFRVGPLFRMLPGTRELKELFKHVMVSVFSFIKANKHEFLLAYHELVTHKGETAFASRGETSIFTEHPLKEHFEDFFIKSKLDPFEQIDLMIEENAAPLAQKLMFAGWEPNY